MSLYLALSFPTSGALMLSQGGALLGNLSVGAEYTSNAQRRSGGSSDLILRATPSIRYERFESALSTMIELGAQYNQYLEDSEASGLDLRASLSLEYPRDISGIPYFIGFQAGITEQTQGEADLGRIEKSTTYSAGITGSYSLSERFGISGASDYQFRKPESGDLAETRTLSIPVSLNYRYSEALSFSGGYRFRETKTSEAERSPRQIDHALFISADGQIFPLVSGTLSAGLQQRRLDEGLGDEVAPFAAGSLDWTISDLTTATLSVSSDFETTLDAQSTETFRVGTDLKHRFNDFWSAGAGLAWRQRSFSETDSKETSTSEDRRDRELRTEMSVTYLINQQINVNLKAQFTINESTFSENDFEEVSLTVRANMPF